MRSASIKWSYKFLVLSRTHLDNGMKEGQHVDERAICRVRAGLETILTYFNVSGANVQLQAIGWLSYHWGRIWRI